MSHKVNMLTLCVLTWNVEIYLQLISFLHADMAHAIEIIYGVRQELIYFP